ncbi:uncharacterized protein LOC115729015 [Rhodamnia argentea]|uniref:Uncharacterized protein LOC115729015 n=1 Tax=Rhodamnia argentea TaxID=178133 RepID=A0A8B8MYU5_9MYRT|nr:uncharacterized protein LOC115729015 [Rhodamnia argentea]XP_048132338.1 uncharacterized protein LOC115729015 [Rhodamnia argentea]
MDLPSSHTDPQQSLHHHRQREGYSLSQSFDKSAPSSYGYYPQYPQGHRDQQYYPYNQYPHPSTSHQTLRPPHGSGPAQQSAPGSGRVDSVSGQVQLQVPQHLYNLLQQCAAAGGGGAPVSGTPGLSGATSAAVAALSQLSQLAATMSVAERVISGFGQPQVSHSPYSGGNQPFRGSNHGHFAHHCASLGGPTINGRVHGRRWHKGGHKIYKGSKSSNNNRKPSLEAQAVEATAACQASDNAVHKAPTQGGKAAWCELCRVECTSLEILEQHKNGKRHKKNMQRAEQLKNAANKIEAPLQNFQDPGAGPGPDSSQLCNIVPQGDLLAKIDGNSSGAIADVPIDTVGQADHSTESSLNLHVQNQVENRKSGKKRKIKGGGEGKRQKKLEATAHPLKPPQSKAVGPIVCDLCNVRCDTREVFDRHLSGKKHIARHIRFEGHRAQYGPLGLQGLYPPNPAAAPLVSHPQGRLEPQILNALYGATPVQNCNAAASDGTAEPTVLVKL